MPSQKSQLRASIYGVGQLITQRKMFAVPEHQRSFSWTKEEIGRFLEDVQNAIERTDGDYFIGLIVMQGLLNGSWVVLDGQQRLATTTMVYSAMRNWLNENELVDDAKQLEAEFIGIRQLGGKYASRLQLNSENRETFDSFIVESKTTPELKAHKEGVLVKGSSNWLLLEGALFCRKWIHEYCGAQPSVKAGAQKLFKFASYLETGVSVIGVEVSTDTDAYILFESLNDRGLNLSALDLVKNYVFSFTNPENAAYFRENWETIARNLEGRDADDFLKVFWTSQFGSVSKLDLYSRVRETFANVTVVTSLVRELADAAEQFNALDDPEHLIWSSFDSVVRDRVMQLLVLGSKLVRPVMLSALRRFDGDQFRELLWVLIVTIVRFQLTLKGRTGIIERNLGRLAKAIWTGEVRAAKDAVRVLKELYTDDVTFVAAFARHVELNGSRLAYLLAKMEETVRSGGGNLEDFRDWKSYLQKASPYRIAKAPSEVERDLLENFYRRIGNFALLEDELSKILGKSGTLIEHSELFKLSQFELTSSLGDKADWNEQDVTMRSERLAGIASQTWKIVP